MHRVTFQQPVVTHSAAAFAIGGPMVLGRLRLSSWRAKQRTLRLNGRRALSDLSGIAPLMRFRGQSWLHNVLSEVHPLSRLNFGYLVATHRSARGDERLLNGGHR